MSHFISVCFNTSPPPSPIRWCAGRSWPHGTAVTALVSAEELATLRADSHLQVIELPPSSRLHDVRASLAKAEAELASVQARAKQLADEIKGLHELETDLQAKAKVEVEAPRPSPFTDAVKAVSEQQAKHAAPKHSTPKK